MSVLYDSDPGRLEVYRPRADGLMSRSFFGSALIHLVVGCLMLTVRFPQPRLAPQRHYRITEVTLLPRRPHPAPEEPAKVAEALGPRDLSLFLNDLAPARSQRRHRGRWHSHHRTPRAPVPTASPLAREMKPEAPEPGDRRRSRMGPQLAEGLPNLLERPMVDSRPLEPTVPPSPVVPEHGSSAPVLPPAHRHDGTAKRAAMSRPSSTRPQVRRPQPLVPSSEQRSGGGDRHEPAPAPQPIMVARAERPNPLGDLLPTPRGSNRTAGPTMTAPLPAVTPPSLPADRPADLPAGHGESGKRIAQLPGDLFGTGSGLGSGPSRRDAALPEGRPGAAEAPGPRRPRVSRGNVGPSPSVGGGETAGINPIPSPGGVRLAEAERPGTVHRGAPSDLGDFGGKGTPVASLPSTGSEAPGSGSGAASAGGGAGGGYGSEGPRAFGGSARPGRPGHHSRGKTAQSGDGTGGAPVGDSGIPIPGAGAGGGPGFPSEGGHDSGSGLGDRERHGKRVARADLPLDGPGNGGRGGGHGTGAGAGTGATVESGPRSFSGTSKRRVSAGPEEGTRSGRRKGKGGSAGDGDAGGVSLPSGGGANDDPGRDAGDGSADTAFQKGRTRPTGVYVSTTGRFTLPGAIYEGDYQYNSHALRIIMDELNSRTKVKVQLGGRYESIAPGSFQRAPVVVFTGHKAFELTEDQRRVLKDYVNSGGMIWADFSHAAFDDSFRSEMEKIFGRRPVPLSSGHAIYRSFYVLHHVPPGDLGDTAPFEGISVGERLGVVITPNRYFSAVGRSLNTSEEVQEGAIQAVVNIYMYAAGNYRAVKDAGD